MHAPLLKFCNGTSHVSLQSQTLQLWHSLLLSRFMKFFSLPAFNLVDKIGGELNYLMVLGLWVERQAPGSLSPGPSLLRERGAIHGSIVQVILSSGASSSAPQIFAVPQVLCGVVPWEIVHKNIQNYVETQWCLRPLELLGMQVDKVISQAQATKGALAAQHSAFMEIQGKLKHLGDHFPVIRSLLGKLVGKIRIHILFVSQPVKTWW